MVESTFWFFGSSRFLILNLLILTLKPLGLVLHRLLAQRDRDISLSISEGNRSVASGGGSRNLRPFAFDYVKCRSEA